MALPATDAFTNTDGVQLTAHSASWTLNPVSGGNADIQGNKLAPDSADTNDSAAHWNADSFSNDQYAQAVFGTAGGAGWGIGVACRVATAATLTYYMFYGHSGVTYATYFAKSVAGTWTQFGSTTAELTNGITIKTPSRRNYHYAIYQ